MLLFLCWCIVLCANYSFSDVKYGTVAIWCFCGNKTKKDSDENGEMFVWSAGTWCTWNYDGRCETFDTLWPVLFYTALFVYQKDNWQMLHFVLHLLVTCFAYKKFISFHIETYVCLCGLLILLILLDIAMMMSKCAVYLCGFMFTLLVCICYMLLRVWISISHSIFKFK